MIWFAAVLPAVGAEKPVRIVYFTADWCAPCQQIKPQMESLKRQGYPIETVDMTNPLPDGHFAASWGVDYVPQWVLLKNGKPVTRFKGAGAAKNIASRIEAELTPRFMAATVRIRVKYGGKVEYATGTCVANNDGHSLILTCAHCVDQAPKEAEVLVQTWGGGGKWKDYRAEVLAHDIGSDTGLLRIQGVLASVNVGNRNPVRGHVVLTVGCSMSKPPTVQRTTINGLNRYVGPDNIETSVAPASGRSGGGLFNLQGELVGVCSAADRQRGVGLGLYAGAAGVKAMVSRDWSKRSATIARACITDGVKRTTSEGQICQCGCGLAGCQCGCGPSVIPPTPPTITPPVIVGTQGPKGDPGINGLNGEDGEPGRPPTPEEIAAAVEVYLRANPPQLTESQLERIAIILAERMPPVVLQPTYEDAVTGEVKDAAWTFQGRLGTPIRLPPVGVNVLSYTGRKTTTKWPLGASGTIAFGDREFKGGNGGGTAAGTDKGAD